MLRAKILVVGKKALKVNRTLVALATNGRIPEASSVVRETVNSIQYDTCSRTRSPGMQTTRRIIAQKNGKNAAEGGTLGRSK